MSGPARILVVDDDVEARAMLAAALQERGYRAACAGAAEAAVEARSFRPDLVVLEMVAAGGVVGDGIARCLRSDSDPLLVFVSREARTASRLLAFDAGADDYVTKPYEMEELLARLRAILRRSGRNGHAVSHIGRLTVDERAHSVAFGGTTIDLGPTDFVLLAVLARHAGQVLSKAKLLQLVWGYEPYDENLVVVRVSLLRRQLGPEAASLIRTVRGVGYVLRDDATV
ncbi:MAG TPA: response regulator transcription factor [Acidimicrobiales bacterium]|nr:response regulator transcription factor [Acidimicrobiales bacterium]